MLSLTPPPIMSAPAVADGRVDYACADGRRVLVLYQPRQAVVRIERSEPLVLEPVAGRPDQWRSDAYEGGPVILTRGADGAALTTPHWPDTVCRR